MNTEEDKIEAILREAKRIRILFGISIVILALILGAIAPVIIRDGLTLSSVENSWGVRSDVRQTPHDTNRYAPEPSDISTTTPVVE